ncbi:hypothetical protein LSH36_686g00008 [Paralvinella palmiformis]|uniref:G-protein coupled receptors family 1 profile domain-containing protein n=1 Tax=Paralvinella palmiformis TaxID=53620 RepID=A0AAD9J3E1_9ANNE|nr:hypothetical protein LSH36_686g00008 [Paralvinella palmiformis]
MRYTMALWSFLGVDITGNRSAYLLNDTSLNISDISSFKQPLEITYIRWIYITLFGIIFLCCILGNFTVIYVILRHKKMRNITNFFLANLALSDLCVGIFCVLPNLSTFLSPYWLLGRVLCKLYYFIQCTSYTASVLILTVISFREILRYHTSDVQQTSY